MPDKTIRQAIDEAVAVETAESKMGALVRLRRSVLAERRSLRLLTVLSIIGMCAAIYLGWSARMALDEFEASRAEARVTSCLNHNEQMERSRQGEKAQLRVVISDRARTPEQQAELDALLARHDAQVDESYPDRDCSPAGIAAYFEEHGR